MTQKGPIMNRVEQYYNEQDQVEWDRLERHRTELAVSLWAMEKYSSPPPAKLLDIGCGPGRYAIELTRRGYTVTLLDLSQANLDLASQKAAEAGVVLNGLHKGDARHLKEFADGAYDIVLLMGPLYHLVSESDRRQALAEAWRVLKPGGVLFAAFINRFSVFRASAKELPTEPVEFWPVYEQIWREGGYTSTIGFTEAYFAHPDEIIPFMELSGWQTQVLLGVEGVVTGMEERVNTMMGEAWERWLEINIMFACEPAARGCSDHLLYVGTKPG
jgi:S-adenosylmethionine-dependent methyltransferase